MKFNGDVIPHMKKSNSYVYIKQEFKKNIHELIPLIDSIMLIAGLEKDHEWSDKDYRAWLQCNAAAILQRCELLLRTHPECYKENEVTPLRGWGTGSLGKSTRGAVIVYNPCSE